MAETKKHLILLHGAIASKQQMEPLEQLLLPDFTVHNLDLPGHGDAALTGSSMSMPVFGQSVLQYLDAHQITDAMIFGYSMGGYVALWLARNFPARVSSVITLATKLEWDPAIAAKEAARLDPAIIEEKFPALASSLRSRHNSLDWKTLLAQTAALMEGLGEKPDLSTADFGAIQQPVLLLLGDRDSMVTLAETVAAHKALPAAQLGILPATPHLFEKADMDLLAFHIRRFASA